MERRNRMRSRLSLCVALVVTGTLFYSMLTWMPAVAADFHVDATVANGFNPDPVTVAPLDSTITFENKDTVISGNSHNLVPDGLTVLDQAFSGACAIAPGETCTVDANPIPNPQGYGYHCTIHPSMTGTVIVEQGAEPSSSASTSPTGSPTGTASPSPSPSASPSASPSPSPSSSPSSSPSASPSASPSPSPSPSPTPDEIDRTVSLKLKKHLKATGAVTAPGDPTGACIDDITVTVQKKKKHGGWKEVGTDQTNPDGDYKVGIPDKTGTYRAKIGTDTRGLGLLICGPDKSGEKFHKHTNNGRHAR